MLIHATDNVLLKIVHIYSSIWACIVLIFQLARNLAIQCHILCACVRLTGSTNMAEACLWVGYFCNPSTCVSRLWFRRPRRWRCAAVTGVFVTTPAAKRRRAATADVVQAWVTGVAFVGSYFPLGMRHINSFHSCQCWFSFSWLSLYSSQPVLKFNEEQLIYWSELNLLYWQKSSHMT